jgi:hypothetical protein
MACLVIFLCVTKYYSADQSNDDGMSWPFNTEMRNAYNIFNLNPEGRDHLDDLGVDGKIILEWILVR